MLYYNVEKLLENSYFIFLIFWKLSDLQLNLVHIHAAKILQDWK